MVMMIMLMVVMIVGAEYPGRGPASWSPRGARVRPLPALG
jgi:hypothetical protein